MCEWSASSAHPEAACSRCAPSRERNVAKERRIYFTQSLRKLRIQTRSKVITGYLGYITQGATDIGKKRLYVEREATKPLERTEQQGVNSTHL